MPPNVSAVFLAAATTCSSSRMSHWSGSALPPACSTSAAAVKIVPGSFGLGSVVLAAIATLAPSAAAFFTIASPMPREAPEMKIVLPCRFIRILRLPEARQHLLDDVVGQTLGHLRVQPGTGMEAVAGHQGRVHHPLHRGMRHGFPPGEPPRLRLVVVARVPSGVPRQRLRQGRKLLHLGQRGKDHVLHARALSHLCGDLVALAQRQPQRHLLRDVVDSGEDHPDVGPPQVAVHQHLKDVFGSRARPGNQLPANRGAACSGELRARVDRRGPPPGCRRRRRPPRSRRRSAAAGAPLLSPPRRSGPRRPRAAPAPCGATGPPARTAAARARPWRRRGSLVRRPEDHLRAPEERDRPAALNVRDHRVPQLCRPALVGGARFGPQRAFGGRADEVATSARWS